MLAKSCHLLLGWSTGVNFCHIIAKMDINSVISAIAKIAPATANLVIQQTQRSETVIKILQELKLDPIQPPKDFDGVYKYALVHYGVYKPEPVLKLFREKEIQGFFWENFNSDHPSTLPKKVEDFLDWNILGDKIRELKDIDIVKEFAEFSEVFVRVARRTMNPGQVVFLKKLLQLIESLKEKPIITTIIVYPYPPEFQSLITEKIKSFCGRKFVFDAFEKFINTNEKGYFTVIGDAGMGKSTIAAKYVFEHKTICYFNNLQENRNSPELFLESIRQQLINRYELTNVENADLSTLLTQATAKLSPNEKLIIVVDALDEVKQDPGGENILYLPKTLPDHVYFLLTRRRYEPTQERLYTEGLKKESLDLTDSKYEKENQHDIQEYIRFCLNNDPEHQAGLKTWIENKNISPDAFVQQLAAKSENNFMYLRYVLPAIAEGKYNDLNLNQLPQGLQDYYQTHWERMNMDDKAQKMKVIILYILVEFAKPIPCNKIAAITEKDEFHVQKILDEWIEYLRKQPEDGYDCYSIYHASFLNFLKPKKELNPEKRKQLLQEVNQKIITYYENIENNHG